MHKFYINNKNVDIKLSAHGVFLDFEKNQKIAKPNSFYLTFGSNETKVPKQDSQSWLRLPFPGEENLSFINNISSHRHHCQIFTTMYTTFTPLLQ